MREIAEAVLLFAGVAVELLCCAGMLRMRVIYDRLHYLAPASFLGPLLITAAILLKFQNLLMALTTLTTFVALAVSGPVVTRVLARAARVRETHALTPDAPELARGAPEPRPAP